MKSFIKNLNNTIVVLLIMIGIVVVTHCTPKIAIRTHLVFTGYPVIAFTTYINKADIYDKKYGRQYSFKGYKGITGNMVSEVKVKKRGFLYFASYGEA